MTLQKPIQKEQKLRMEPDSYVRLLDSEVEAFLASGDVVRGVLIAVSKYALTLRSIDGLTVINKAYLVKVRQKT
jgi:hypothetical protein